jgi:hypothetical protein
MANFNRARRRSVVEYRGLEVALGNSLREQILRVKDSGSFRVVT